MYYFIMQYFANNNKQFCQFRSTSCICTFRSLNISVSIDSKFIGGIVSYIDYDGIWISTKLNTNFHRKQIAATSETIKTFVCDVKTPISWLNNFSFRFVFALHS